MNVFGDPKCRKTKMLCPVLFLIHGGKFAFDSAVMYNETQIVQKYASDGVVFVIPAYRLGVFGFLDLGNDNVVPRNLGFHDIIYALEWTKREIKSFGGDPGKVTIMGFSAGASAVEYLLESPKVPQAMFKQAIVCSAVPFLTKNANQPQTLAIMDHVKCLFNETTNRTFSDVEKVNCLRKISAQDLINTQRYIEDNFNLRFRSPETDTDILPGENLADMLTTYKARPLLITTTRNEMSAMDSLDVECDKAEIPFGYKTRAVHQACVKRYKKSGKWPKQPSSGNNPNIIAESIHAQSFQISLVNARKGAPTYRGYFTLANHSVHAEDMRFFFGFHFQPVTYTFAERMMDHYYPAMIKNFLKTGVPDTGWQQVDQNGNNYFMLDFQTPNDTIVVKPHPEPGQEDPRSVKFWLLDAFTLEQNEKQRLKQRQNQYSSRRVPENESLPYFPIFSNLILPAFASEKSPSGSNDGTLQKVELLVDGFIISGQPTVIVNDTGKPVSKVWSGFWLSSEVIVLLLIVIVMLVGSRMLYRYKMVQGYLYKSSNGYLTENTQILSRNEMRKQYTF